MALLIFYKCLLAVLGAIVLIGYVDSVEPIQSHANRNELIVRQGPSIPRTVLPDVRKPYNPLDDATIDTFIRFVNDANNNLQTNFKLADVSFYAIPDQYNNFRSDGTRDDIQILYSGPLSEEDGIGHYICIFYEHDKNQVTIYDSLYYENIVLPSALMNIIKRLYPSIRSGRGRVVFVQPKTIQRDGVTCGLFSIVHATGLLFGMRPENTRYKLKCFGDYGYYFRRHLEEIFLTRKITPFPTAKFALCTKGNEYLYKNGYVHRFRKMKRRIKKLPKKIGDIFSKHCEPRPNVVLNPPATRNRNL